MMMESVIYMDSIASPYHFCEYQDYSLAIRYSPIFIPIVVPNPTTNAIRKIEKWLIVIEFEMTILGLVSDSRTDSMVS